MITDPARQKQSRAPVRSPRSLELGREHVVLAGRLTARDRWLLRMLHEHRVLTTELVTALAFGSTPIARRRLGKLRTYGVIDRFRPRGRHGTASAHWLLAPAGAAVLAAEAGLAPKTLGYRAEDAYGIAHSLHLAHTVGVNEWFTTLTAAPRHHPPTPTVLTAWWSERRCRHLWGDLVRPDGYGRITTRDIECTTSATAPAEMPVMDFFLEFDLATSTPARVAAKLTGYADLAQATGITTPVLVWTTTGARETSLRVALAHARTELAEPDSVPVATAAAAHLDPTHPYPSPGDRVWLPVHPPTSERRPLHQLPAAWPHLSPPADLDEMTEPLLDSRRALLPPTPPLPPDFGDGHA
ncbi:hypothetical protein GZH49_12205 [Nocardia terpenica]|uniref:replication-relaxation family protein n=1 Tax=Nocardia terpenica TaxID=455432 RepID=UPI002FE1AA0C